jgi:hypothetical protein
MLRTKEQIHRNIPTSSISQKTFYPFSQKVFAKVNDNIPILLSTVASALLGGLPTHFIEENC